MAQSEGSPLRADFVVVGAGVLGTAISHWLASALDCKVLVLDMASTVASHQSSRNTGLIHRPFYLDPTTRGDFIIASNLSYPLWESLSKESGLPWAQVGTLDVAVDDAGVKALRRYMTWGPQNGMHDDELELLDGKSAQALEPEVKCQLAIHSKTDASVDFGKMTRALAAASAPNGVTFLMGASVESVEETKDGGASVGFRKGGSRFQVSCKWVINAAGGGALDLAHSVGLARSCAALHFRGEYWKVDEPMASRVKTNVYTPPRFAAFPFLDPHFVVRADGTRQVGPNAVLVPGPYVYSGFGLGSIKHLLGPPTEPKIRLSLSRGFSRMVAEEWKSSLSKKALCQRVRKFIPSLSPSMLTERGTAGVRSSVVGKNGFVAEPLLFVSGPTAHLVNFNSPGATGAPAFAASVVSRLLEAWVGSGLRVRKKPPRFLGWDFESVLDAYGDRKVRIQD